MQGLRGSSKVMFGYGLTSSERDNICKNNWHFLGLRIQFQLRRGANGTTTDYIQAGCTGLRLSLGTSTNNFNTYSSNKRALVLAGNTTWNDFNKGGQLQLETR
jgi:hypothetical protein